MIARRAASTTLWAAGSLACLVATAVACGACGAADAGPSAPSAAAPVDTSSSLDARDASSSTSTGPSSSAPDASPDASPDAAGPPAALACLAKLYVGTPVAAGASSGGWALHLASGTELAWNDGKVKSFDEALATPDLEDTLAMPYPTGAIKPVATLNDDPGRIRSDALLKATFGASATAVEQELVNVDFVGQTVRFHTRAAAALRKVSTRLEQLVAQTPSLAAYVTGTLGGTYEWRPIANTNRLSAHSYGIAIDIVVSKSNYWEWEKTGTTFVWKNQIPQAVVDAFEAEGFAWGGRWYHYDTMHFEYRPELFDPACKP